MDIDIVFKLVDQFSAPAKAMNQAVKASAEQAEAITNAGQASAKKAEEVQNAGRASAKKAQEVTDAAQKNVDRLRQLQIDADQERRNAARAAAQGGPATSSAAAYVPDPPDPVPPDFMAKLGGYSTAVTGMLDTVKDKLNGIGDAMKAQGEALSGYANKVAVAGAAMSAAFTLPALALSQLQKNFDASLEPLKATMPADRFEEMRKAVLELGAQFPAAQSGMKDFFANTNQPLSEQIALFKLAAQASAAWGTDTGAALLDLQKKLGLTSAQMQTLVEQVNALPADQRQEAIKNTTGVTTAPNQPQLAQKMAEDASKAADTLGNHLAQLAARLTAMGVQIATPWTAARAAIDGVLASLSSAAFAKIDSVLKAIGANDTAISAISGVFGALAALGPGMISAAAGMKAVGEAWAFLGPLVIAGSPFVLGLIALGAALAAVAANWDTVKPAWDEMKSAMSGLGSAIVDTGIGPAITDIAKSVGELFSFDMSKWTWGGFISDAALGFAKDMASLLREVANGIKTLTDLIHNLKTSGIAKTLNDALPFPLLAETTKGTPELGAPGFIGDEPVPGVLPWPLPPLKGTTPVVPPAPIVPPDWGAVKPPPLTAPPDWKSLLAPPAEATAPPPITPNWSAMKPPKAVSPAATSPPRLAFGGSVPSVPPRRPTLPGAQAGGVGPGDQGAVSRAAETQGTDLVLKLKNLFNELSGQKLATAAAAAPPTGMALPPGITLQAEGPSVTVKQAPPNISISTVVNVANPTDAPAEVGSRVSASVASAARGSMYDSTGE